MRMYLQLLTLLAATGAISGGQARSIRSGTMRKVVKRGPFLDHSSTTLAAREVPQEHSHERFLTSVRTSLNMDNPLAIADPVFALLGNAAASSGVPNVDPDCLQQVVADQAFTNAKAAGDVDAMTAALVFRALERNTGAVGTASAACTSVTATNPEIAAIAQHQDPASDGAAAANKAVTLQLAMQIASIGGDPQVALQSGTFAPGQIGDPTAAGNSCDDQNEIEGCIFTQNLLVEDATAAEIDAAVAGIAASSGAAAVASTSASAAASTSDSASATAASSSSSRAATTSAAASDSSTASIAADLADATANIDFGACSNIGMIFAVGLDNRKETAFEPADLTAFSHGSAQNPGIIAQFMCDTLINNKCVEQGSDAHNTCLSALAAVQAQPADQLKTGSSADLWNAAFGISSDFAAVQPFDDQGNPVGIVAAAAATTATQAADVTTSSTAATSTPTASSTAATSASTAANTVSADSASTTIAEAAALAANIDLGSCPNIAMAFGDGIEGRTETSFIPADTTQFNHGSAQNPSIIAQFMCDNLVINCGLTSTDTGVTTCRTAQAAVAATTARDGSVADTWNSAFGITTNFAPIPVIDNQGNTVVQSGTAATQAAVAASSAGTVASSADATTSSAADAANTDAATTTAAAAATTSSTGQNLQTFTGALGGLTAPAVTTGGRGFVVSGSDDFLNTGAALGRSCDIQHNQCANAANGASKGEFSVGDCDQQNTDCHATI